MTAGTLSAALEREHHEIDAGIEDFTAGVAHGENRAESLTQAITALRRHIYLEEEFIFPTLRQSGLMAPIFVMLREHGELWRTLDAVQAALTEAADPAPVELCQQLLEQLDRHNTKEEPIIYPQADTALDPQAQSDLMTFLDSGAMPDGWTCQKAAA